MFQQVLSTSLASMALIQLLQENDMEDIYLCSYLRSQVPSIFIVCVCLSYFFLSVLDDTRSPNLMSTPAIMVTRR